MPLMFVLNRWHASRYVRFGKGYTISHTRVAPADSRSG